TEKAALDAGALARARRRALARLDDVLRYAGSLHCRRQHLLHYFGEASPARCGRCDVCLGRHRPAAVTPEDEPLLRRILAHVERGEPRADWLAGEGLPAHRRDGLADWLVHEGLLQVEDPLAAALALTPKALRLLRGRAGGIGGVVRSLGLPAKPFPLLHLLPSMLRPILSTPPRVGYSSHHTSCPGGLSMRHAPCFLLSLLAVVLTLAPLSAGAQEDPLGFG